MPIITYKPVTTQDLDNELKPTETILSDIRSQASVRYMRLFESPEDVKAVFPYDADRIKVVDLAAEGIPAPNNAVKKAAKIELKANETFVLRISPPLLKSRVSSVILNVLTTNTARIDSYMLSQGTMPPWFYVDNLPDIWVFVSLLTIRHSLDAGIILNGGAAGGNIYISFCVLREPESDFLTYTSFVPNKTITNADGTITFQIYVYNVPYKLNITRLGAVIAGDGTNAINVTVQVRDRFGTPQTVGTLSRTSATPATVDLFFPLALDNTFTARPPYIILQLQISTASTVGTLFRSLIIDLHNARYEHVFIRPQYITNTVSSSSTTPTTLALIAASGRLLKLQNPKVTITRGAGSGSVVILYDGIEVTPPITTTGTFTLPEVENISKVEARITGDGVNATSVQLETIRHLGAFGGAWF